MNIDLIAVGSLFTAVVSIAALVVWVSGTRDGVGLEDLFVRPDAMPWPRGVQEEEPVRWRIERLTPRTARAPEVPAAQRAIHGRPRAAPGTHR
jgi:hypothetical protein